MRLNKYLDNINCFIINLKNRNDKKEYIKSHLKKLSSSFSYTFFNAEKHSNPKRGCLESHLSIIKDALKKNMKYILILEDDCNFIQDFSKMESPPSDWNMIYLGGTVHRILDRKNKGYARVQCWTTHAYIINLTDNTFVQKLLELENYDEEIDRYYLEKIHPNFNCYVCDPMIAIQKEGFFFFFFKEVSYDFM